MALTTSRKKKLLWIGMVLWGLLICVLGLSHDYLRGRQPHFGTIDMSVIFAGLAFVVIGSVLWLFERYRLYQRKQFSAKIYLYEAVLTGVLLIFLAAAGIVLWTALLSPPHRDTFAIGIYQCLSSEPFEFSGTGIDNPVLTARDVTDVKAEFLADPFLVHEGGAFYLFFEVFNSITEQGDIGLAISQDGLRWNYQKIIIDEPFHLEYPCVFKWNGEFYMLQDSGKENSLACYKAHHFPTGWSLFQTIPRSKRGADRTIFYYQDTWWLFSGTAKRDALELEYAETPLGPWREHPKSPVISDANKSSPAGPVVIFDGRVVRFAQDVEPYYGNQVWAFEITRLTKEDYQERQIGLRPILKGYENWNTKGMHQISPVRIGPQKWIAAVDGY